MFRVRLVLDWCVGSIGCSLSSWFVSSSHAGAYRPSDASVVEALLGLYCGGVDGESDVERTEVRSDVLIVSTGRSVPKQTNFAAHLPGHNVPQAAVCRHSSEVPSICGSISDFVVKISYMYTASDQPFTNT